MDYLIKINLGFYAKLDKAEKIRLKSELERALKKFSDDKGEDGQNHDYFMELITIEEVKRGN